MSDDKLLNYIVVGRVEYGENDLSHILARDYDEAVAIFKKNMLMDVQDEDKKETEVYVEAVIEILPRYRNLIDASLARVLHHPAWGKLEGEEVITI